MALIGESKSPHRATAADWSCASGMPVSASWIHCGGTRTPGPLVARADRLVDRLRGIIGRERLLDFAALLIRPCAAVHTLGVGHAIDLAFLDGDDRIVALREDVGRNRLAYAWRARGVLELRAGDVERWRLATPGTRFEFAPLDAALASERLASAAYQGRRS